MVGKPEVMARIGSVGVTSGFPVIRPESLASINGIATVWRHRGRLGNRGLWISSPRMPKNPRSLGAFGPNPSETPRSVQAHACSSKRFWSAKSAPFLFAHSRPTFVSPSSRTMSESPSATAARIERPSDDQETRRATNVARSPKSVI